MDEYAHAPRSLRESGADLNAAVAREVMGWTSLGAQLWRDAQGTVFFTGQDVTRVFVPHVAFNPSSNALHAAWVEAQIEHLGKRVAYLDALMSELAPGLDTLEAQQVSEGVQAKDHAAPVQRCWAALQVVRAGGAGP